MNLAEACEVVDECCDDDGSTTNKSYGECMQARDDLNVPDLGSLIPGECRRS